MSMLTTAPPPAFTIHGLGTVGETVAALNAAVDNAANGPHTRTGDTYISGDGRPYCIVGHVLVAAGVPADWFAGKCQIIDEADPGDVEACDRNRRGIHVIGDELGLPVPVACVLAEAQMAQDTGGTWGYAVTCARSEARRLTRQAAAKARRTRRFAFLR